MFQSFISPNANHNKKTNANNEHTTDHEQARVLTPLVYYLTASSAKLSQFQKFPSKIHYDYTVTWLVQLVIMSRTALDLIQNLPTTIIATHT